VEHSFFKVNGMLKDRIQFLINNLKMPLLVIDTAEVGELKCGANVTIFKSHSLQDILKLLSKIKNMTVILDGWYTVFHDEIERKWFRDSLRTLAIKNNLVIL